MSNFALDLIIDPNDLDVIKGAQLRIMLAKPVNTDQTPNVVWLAIDPWEGVKVEWEEKYGIYASAIDTLSDGTVISKLSETSFPATDGRYYSFANSRFDGPFDGPDDPNLGSYSVRNNMPYASYPQLTFGLEQAASISGKKITPSPLNAAITPASYKATFTPLTTVYIWLQASFQSGTVITNIAGKAAVVTFGQQTEQGLTYDPKQGMFVPSANGKIISFEEFENVKLLLPSGVY